MKRKKALVLSGGSIKGAFHVGAIRRLIEEGFEPDIILGISVGAVSAAYLVNNMGSQGKKQSFAFALEELTKFWFTHASEPRTVMQRRPLWSLGYGLIRKRFKSFMDTSEYFSWFDSLSAQNISKSRIELIVGAVNLYTGKIEYFNSSHPHIVEASKASSIIPLIMPPVYINGIPYVDGGLRDVVPLRPLVQGDELSELVIVITHPGQLAKEEFNIGNLGEYINRTKNITVNQIIRGDLDNIHKFNQKLLFFLKKKIPYRIIRPSKELKFTLDRFNLDDIKNMMSLGYESAKNSTWL